MNRWYEVHNYADGNEYVNENSDISDPEKVWTTPIPWGFKPNEDYSPTPPYRFSRRADAVRIKDALQSVRLDLWRNTRNSLWGPRESRPNWKVYTHTVDNT